MHKVGAIAKNRLNFPFWCGVACIAYRYDDARVNRANKRNAIIRIGFIVFWSIFSSLGSLNFI